MRIEVEPGRLEAAIRESHRHGGELERELRRRGAGVTRAGRRKLKAAKALKRLRRPRRAEHHGSGRG